MLRFPAVRPHARLGCGKMGRVAARNLQSRVHRERRRGVCPEMVVVGARVECSLLAWTQGMLQDGTKMGGGQLVREEDALAREVSGMRGDSNLSAIASASLRSAGDNGRCVSTPTNGAGTQSRDTGHSPRPHGPHGPPYRRRPTAYPIPFAVPLVLAVLFVVWETALRRFLPTMPIRWHHTLLTLWARAVTAVASTGVWLIMHRQQRALSGTAARLTRFLESYNTARSQPLYFTNPLSSATASFKSTAGESTVVRPWGRGRPLPLEFRFGTVLRKYRDENAFDTSCRR